MLLDDSDVQQQALLQVSHPLYYNRKPPLIFLQLHRLQQRLVELLRHPSTNVQYAESDL